MADEQTISRQELCSWAKQHGEVIAIALTSAVVLIAMQYAVKAGMLAVILDGAAWSDDLNRLVGWAMGCVLLYLVLPMVVLKLLGRSVRDCGWNLRGMRAHWRLYALLLIPVGIAVVLVSSLPGFQASYPFLKNPVDWRELMIWECCYVA